MTTTLHATPTAHTTSRTRAPLGRLLAVSAGATVVAGAVTEAWVALARVAGVHVAVGDFFGDPSVAPQAIPAGSYAFSIALCMVVGTAIAALLNWRARRPARTYVVIAAVLTFVSLGAPLVSAGATAGTKVTLIVAHLIAAAVIVPMVARCLAKRG